MAKYHLVHTESKATYFNLTRLEMVNKLKQAGDLQNWFCWYPGLGQWKIVTQAYEVKEWMSFPWTEDQPMPPWQNLFNKSGATGDFEIVEYNEAPQLIPPPLPAENAPSTQNTTDFVISGFSGQVFDFDESLKDKHFKSNEFKIIEQTQEQTQDHPQDHTAKINIETLEVREETSKIENANDFTITKDIVSPPSAPLAETTAVSETTKAKKHNRRYPRIKGKLRTIITNKSKAFMTFTKDISLGGIHVENIIPQDILNSEIEVYLSDPTGKKSILFRCHPVGEMNNPCRFSFAKADEKNLQRLSQWLVDLEKINAA